MPKNTEQYETTSAISSVTAFYMYLARLPLNTFISNYHEWDCYHIFIYGKAYFKYVIKVDLR